MNEVDENADNIVQQYRRLATQENYDIILGYVSSANALSVAPVVEELGQPILSGTLGRRNCTTGLLLTLNTCSEHRQVVQLTQSVLHVFLDNALPDVQIVAGVNQYSVPHKAR